MFDKQKKAQTQRAKPAPKLEEKDEFAKGDGGLALDAYLNFLDWISIHPLWI